MFKYVIFILMCMSTLSAQNNANQRDSDVEVGDTYKIGKPEARTYKHISFPRLNFIVKKGGIANYKRAEGKIVVVTSIKEKKDGTTQITLRREDGGRFFGSHTFVSANLNKAIASGELRAM